MRAIFRVLKKAWSVAKEDRQLRRAAIILWVFYLLNYVVLMVQPLLQSSLLDGVELIIRVGTESL